MFTTNIEKFGLEFLFFTKRKNEMKLLMNISDIDVCFVFDSGKTTAPMIRLIRDLLDSGGNLPKKCPIPKGYKYEFKDLNPDPKFFPFLPDMKFILSLKFALNNVPQSYVLNITGDITSLRRG